jgi:hypothetical protein
MPKNQNDWENLGKPESNIKGNTYRHKPSGWTIMHCGGFSPIYPWCLGDPNPAHPAPVYSMSGKGFAHLKDAKEAVIGLVEGRLKVMRFNHRDKEGNVLRYQRVIREVVNVPKS